MKAYAVICLAIVAFVVMFQSSEALIGRCRCAGRCGEFSCPDPNNTRGCNCVTCQCIRGNIGFQRCCAHNCGFWNSSNRCFHCKPWQSSCSCSGCR